MVPVLIEEDVDSRLERVIHENQDLEHCMYFVVLPSPRNYKDKYFIKSVRVDGAFDHWRNKTDSHATHYSASKFLLCMLNGYILQTHQHVEERLLPKLAPQHNLPIKKDHPPRHFMIFRDFHPRQGQEQFIIVEFAERNAQKKAISLYNYKKLCRTHPRLLIFESFEDFATQFPHPWKLYLGH